MNKRVGLYLVIVAFILFLVAIMFNYSVGGSSNSKDTKYTVNYNVDEGIYIISDVSYDPKSMYVSFSLDQINEFGATTLKIVFTSDDETIFEQNIELDGSLNNKQHFKFKIPKRKIKANKMSFKFIPIDDEVVSVDTQTMAG